MEELVDPPSRSLQPLRSHWRCRWPRLQQETNPLFCAVESNKLNELKALVKAGNSINIRNSKGSSLLNVVMEQKRTEIFQYLLSLEELDVNFPDSHGQTPLIFLPGVCFSEYFTMQLIKKGANIHATDDCGFTFLHLAARDEFQDNLNAGQLIIEMGADIDQPAQNGATPLHRACQSGNTKWVHMLLYYNADATICNEQGLLPLTVLYEYLPKQDYVLLQEILFNYTFSHYKLIVSLPALIAAMVLNNSLFSKMLDYVSGVCYTEHDLQCFASSLIYIQPAHLRLFMEKFGHIIKEMIIKFSPLSFLSAVTLDGQTKDILNVFLNSDYVAEFIQLADFYSSIISLLLDVISHQDEFINQEEITKIICIMLTYGLTVTAEDLDAVFHYFGDCELFRILLHMDIIMTSSDYAPTFAKLFYDPLLNVERFIENNAIINSDLYEKLLDYYDLSKIKVFLSSHSEITQVPLLLELSRNAVRKFIVEKFNVENSSQFYTVVQCLPIGEMNKNIITFKKKLY